MNDALAKYVNGLPLRRLLGGLILAIVWLAPATIDFANSGRFHTQRIDALHLFAIFVAPLCVLGFLWGYIERRILERAIAAGADQLDLGGVIGRHAAAGMMCGAAFFLFSSFVLPGRAGDSKDNILAHLSEVPAGLIGGLIVGAIVGAITLRGLRRRVSPTVV
jgi:hypothetical protein